MLAPFTTDAAEFNVLSSGNKLNIGYVPAQNVPKYAGKIWCGANPCAGKNNPQLAANYNLSPLYGWSVNYFPVNFTNPTTGPIVKQLYVRQAMQELMNQSLWIQLYDAGYGLPTYGPVPVLPDVVRLEDGEREPVPLQPVECEGAALIARLECCPERRHDLCEARNRQERVRCRYRQGCPVGVQLPVLQRRHQLQRSDPGDGDELGAGRYQAQPRRQVLR